MWENAATFYLNNLANPLIYTVGTIFLLVFSWKSFKTIIHNRLLRNAFTICEVLDKYHKAYPEKAKQHKEELNRIGRLAKSFHVFEEKVNTPIVLDILFSKPIPRSTSEFKRFNAFLEEPGMKKVLEKTISLYISSMILASPWVFIVAFPIFVIAAFYKKTSKMLDSVSHVVTLSCDKDVSNKLATM